MPGIAAIPAAMCFSNGLDVCLRSIPSIIKRGWYRSIIGAHMRPGEALIASLQRHRPRSSKTTLSSPVNARAPPHASILCCRPNSCISMRWAEVGERSATEGPLVCNNIMAPSMVSKATQRQLTYPALPGSRILFDVWELDPPCGVPIGYPFLSVHQVQHQQRRAIMHGDSDFPPEGSRADAPCEVGPRNMSDALNMNAWPMRA